MSQTACIQGYAHYLVLHDVFGDISCLLCTRKKPPPKPKVTRARREFPRQPVTSLSADPVFASAQNFRRLLLHMARLCSCSLSAHKGHGDGVEIRRFTHDRKRWTSGKKRQNQETQREK